MAEITTRRVSELVRKLFGILAEHPDGLRAAAAVEKLANAVTLTEHEAGSYAPGVRRFDKIVRFATIVCVKAGWLNKHRGTWSLTEEGVAAYKAYSDPEEFYREATRRYRKWKAAQVNAETSESTSSADEASTPEDSATITFEQAEEQAWSEIERYLSSMDPYDFQHLVADLLQAMGYFVTWISPPGKDGGVDIIAYTDPLGTKPPRIKVQVKRVATKVDIDGLKSFLAIVNDHDVGLFVATAGFTKDAQDFARAQERRQITLIDLERLVDLWVQHFSRLDDLARRRLPLTPIYFLTPQS
jgi:restriction system protein